MEGLASRLERLCVPVPESGCWLWIGATTPSGYGKITVSTGVTAYAHRVSWAMRHGDLPSQMYVCHKCDTPSCINPDHLFAGLPRDNSIDAMAKGRTAFGRRVSSAKLSEDDVVAIFNSTGTCKSLGKKFGVSPSTISHIRRGEHWVRITEPTRA